MKHKSYRNILDSAAADSLSRNRDLWPGISAQIERKTLMTALRARPLAVLMMVLLALLALSGAAYALSRTLGYIPGVGLVDQSAPLRILAAPAVLERDGITVTVSNVVADPTSTFVAYQVEGIPAGTPRPSGCSSLPDVRLPDGSLLENTGGGDGIPVVRDGETRKYAAEFTYTPVPNNGSRLTFALSCVVPAGPGSGPWEIALDLIPAPAGFATPVVEIAAPVETDANSTGLHLEKVLELDNSYVLMGKFVDGGDLPAPVSISTGSDSEYMPHIEDGNGHPIEFKVREDLRPDPEWDVAYYWAYEIPKPVTGPVKLTVEQVNVWKHHTAEFPLETAALPLTGMAWDLQQTVQLGSSEFVVKTVTFIGNGYEFTLSSANLPEGVTPWVDILDSAGNVFQFDNIDSKQVPAGDHVQYTVTLTSQAPPPVGNLTVQWSLDETFPQPGPWSILWSPPAGSP